MTHRKRYAIVGTGGRAGMYVQALTTTYGEVAELVALCDLSQTRMDWYNRKLADTLDLAPVPTYHAERFSQMIAEAQPETVIVATIDATHHHYITEAMNLGCDVITEKPMTTDLPRLRAIFEAIERTGRSLRVTFNYRYAPAYTRFRQLLPASQQGEVFARWRFPPASETNCGSRSSMPCPARPPCTHDHAPTAPPATLFCRPVAPPGPSLKYTIDPSKPIQANVPVRLVGEAPAVRDLAGTLLQSLDQVSIRCLPLAIPDAIEAEAGILKGFDVTLTVADIVAPEGIEILTDPGINIAVVNPPRVRLQG